ncbi:MAG: glycosyltransferase family 4 protein [Gemmatimonadaceae bacterium]|nr:glycosyltransferase family 4 protein [Gemmatimonadaceae bacterium]
MRILLLSQWFDPEPAIKGMAFAQALRARGHEVTVLTGFPNYPDGVVYPGFRLRAVDDQMVDGIRVRRVWLYPSHDRGALKRVANYVSFALSAAVSGFRGLPRPDVIYAYHPPITIGIPAVVLGRRWRVPFVLDVQDLWPDTVAASGMMSRPALLGILQRFCAYVYRSAAHVVVLSPGFRTELVARGLPSERVTVIPNWSPEATSSGEPDAAAERAALGFGDRLVVLFAGTMGVSQHLQVVLDAAREAHTRVPAALFVFIGGGTDRATLEAAAAGLPNVRFLPRRSMAEMPPLLAAADVLLVHLRDEPLFRITIPSKTQAYLAAGRPILMAVRGDAAAMVAAAGAGMVVPPDDAAALVDAVAALAALGPAGRDALGRAGREYYAAHLSLDAGVTAFERVFSLLTTASTHDSSASSPAAALAGKAS